MQQRTVEPGHQFAGRYRLQDLLDDADGVRSWRAMDDLLGRAVLIQTVPLADPRAAEIGRAGRAAALATDPRLLRVLDISAEGDHAYLVREWVVGDNLAALLADGPLPPEEACVLACEVAQAISAAHAQGLTHRCIDPTAVVVSHDGAIKIVGLATKAVLHPLLSTDPARDDVEGIGRVLYAALTGRWPGHETYGLPPAPHVEGHLASPRQVRAGVPSVLDQVTDRLLNERPRHGQAPIRTPAEAAAILTHICPPAPPSGLRRLTMHRADYDDSPPALVSSPLVDPRTHARVNSSPGPTNSARISHDTAAMPRVDATSHPQPQSPRRWSRLLAVISAAAFLLAIGLIGLQLLDSNPEPAPAQTTVPTATPTPSQLPIDRAIAYDPLGDREESDRRAGEAIDGDTDTQWQTQTYFDPLEIQKAGVGLVLDLGKPSEIRQLRMTLADPGGAVEIKAAPEDASAPPEDPGDWLDLVTRDNPPEEVDVAFPEAVTSRYLLVWFTKLPQVSSGEWRSAIVEAQLLG